MADKVNPQTGELVTANYGWTKPTVGSSTDAWGGYLNADLDGIDTTVKAVSNAIPAASSTTPVMNGTAAAGTGTTWARADHVHPTDTTCYQASNPSGYQTAAQVMTATNACLKLTGGTLTGAMAGTSAVFSSTLTALSHSTRAGTAAGAQATGFNIDWESPAAILWINNVNVGTLAFTSDYRIKKDVTPLPSMWERAKALRPVSYTHQDYTPPNTPAKEDGSAPDPIIIGDDVERWGFIAHELQETLIGDAATGAKDQADCIQSPNVMTVVATLTKALQEAITRIETLEAKLA